MNKKKREQRKLIIGGVVVLFLLGAVIALASQLGMFKGYLGSRADDSCKCDWAFPGQSGCNGSKLFTCGISGTPGNCSGWWNEIQDCAASGKTCIGGESTGGSASCQGSGGTGGGGGGCDGNSSNSICKGRCNPGPCNASDGTRGNCYVVTQPNNCGWSPSTSTTPVPTKAPTVTAVPSPKPSTTAVPSPKPTSTSCIPDGYPDTYPYLDRSCCSGRSYVYKGETLCGKNGSLCYGSGGSCKLVCSSSETNNNLGQYDCNNFNRCCVKK